MHRSSSFPLGDGDLILKRRDKGGGAEIHSKEARTVCGEGRGFARSEVPLFLSLFGLHCGLCHSIHSVRLKVCWRSDSPPSWSVWFHLDFLFSLSLLLPFLSGPHNLKIYANSC